MTHSNHVDLLGDGAASWGVLYEHKKLVELAEESDKKEQEALKAAAHDEAVCTDPTHDHSHSSSNHAVADHDEATCTDPTHDHSHSSSSHAVADHDETTCTDPTHDHSHSSSSHAVADHDETTCTDPTHDHSHLSSNHAVVDHDEATCTDPTHDHSHSSTNHADHDEATCTDPTHDHSHSKTQQQSSPTTTADERFGINSFVYKRRTPFHPGRFSLFLQGLGKLSVKGISEIASTEEKRVSVGEAEGLTVAKKALLRSKGFVWMGTSKTAAYFISHAGQYLELMVLGRWWADIPQADWPKGSEDEITVDFDGHNGK
jgi:G3E family GTPase